MRCMMFLCTAQKLLTRAPGWEILPAVTEYPRLVAVTTRKEFEMAEAFFDVSKVLKEFDPTKMVGEFSNMLKQYKLQFSSAVRPDHLSRCGHCRPQHDHLNGRSNHRECWGQPRS